MKIHILSDLHIEFVPFEPPPTEADVVVLAGDIGTKLSGVRMAVKMFEKPVVYVSGNHEYYGAAMPDLTEKLRAEARGTNVRYLEQDETLIGGVRFLGCTLWTDFALFGRDDRADAMARAEERMTDYRRIRRSPRYRRLRASDTLASHAASVAWLRSRLNERHDGPTVVVTHHAPIPEGIHERYREDALAPAYASNLVELMDGAQVALWIHGHTHCHVDRLERGTRVVSNQRGYPDEPADGFDPSFVVSL